MPRAVRLFVVVAAQNLGVLADGFGHTAGEVADALLDFVICVFVGLGFDASGVVDKSVVVHPGAAACAPCGPFANLLERGWAVEGDVQVNVVKCWAFDNDVDAHVACSLFALVFLAARDYIITQRAGSVNRQFSEFPKFVA